ncbi:hypothetical protein [Algoriphagus boritolerans]|uniref:Uncharacterized protein n=1 Tax=Algoriphagus boritolerans DSM 17298 = JCM 18970 TaxID=1120964 RepID=A0A1H5ZT90_9BACT|nr:hypothetical protein [Algoriphagus boritolerans]SEG39370.1 hypothetical protein SAMN03080598_03712 [Algoriphagus boritolerans DSM 17298 = JCM 18970]
MSQNPSNYDEIKVPALALSDPFISEKGKLIQTVEEWEMVRRPEIFRLFQDEVYG